MNATMLYVVMKALCNIVMTAGIIIATCYLQLWGLLFFLIIPACGMSLEVKSQGNNSSVSNLEDKNEKV